jgi:hypothetical protein
MPDWGPLVAASVLVVVPLVRHTVARATLLAEPSPFLLASLLKKLIEALL